MGTPTAYEPPTADKIAAAQDTDANLKLLLAQRRLYSRAKVWTNIRGVGVGLIAIAAPVLAAVWEPAAVPAATVAALWYVLNRVLFRYLERRDAARGASVQEQFDTIVFGMPQVTVREPRVLPEDIARITRIGKHIRRALDAEKLRGWYSIQAGVPGRIAIAIAQRENASYSRRLLTRHASLWLSVLAAWAAIAVVVGLWSEFSFATFLLVIAIPVFPPLVDAWDEFLQVRAAGREQEALANQIEGRNQRRRRVGHPSRATPGLAVAAIRTPSRGTTGSRLAVSAASRRQ